MHPHLGELQVALQSHKTNIDSRRNVTTVELNFIQQDDINLLNVDFHSLLVETIKKAKQSVVFSTVNIINTDINKQQTIFDISKNINRTINESNLSSTLTESINNVPVITQSINPITLTFNAQHTAISAASAKIGKKYHSTLDLTKDAKHINQIFNTPAISNSSLSNDFYNLKATLARYLIETNQDLPKLKQHSTNTPLPSDLLRHQLGESVDDFNTSIHPLFNEQASYVS